jgi:hypothetical protein
VSLPILQESEMIDWIDQKSIDLAIEAAKQLIALTVGILGLSAAFSKTITTGAAWRRIALVISWFVYLISLASGMAFLLSLTAQFDTSSEKAVVGTLSEPVQAVPQGSLSLRPRIVVATRNPQNGKWTVGNAIALPSIWSEDLRLAVGVQLVAFSLGTAIIFAILVAAVLRGRAPRKGRRWKAARSARVATRRRRREGQELTRSMGTAQLMHSLGSTPNPSTDAGTA